MAKGRFPGLSTRVFRGILPELGRSFWRSIRSVQNCSLTMGEGLTANVGICHVIFGQLGMKVSYHSYNSRTWRAKFPVFAGVFAVLFGLVPFLLATAAAVGAPMRSGDDSLLTGGRPGPCAGASQGAEYIGGADANGHFVAPADLDAPASVQLDSETVYADVGTGRRGRANVAVDVKGLKAAMAAPSACRPRRR